MRNALMTTTTALFAAAALSAAHADPLEDSFDNDRDPAYSDIGRGDNALDGDAIGETNDATETVQDIVDDPVRDEDGLMQAETGGAEPRENWMGCEIADVAGSDECQDPGEG
jgi:hypothetical protein